MRMNRIPTDPMKSQFYNVNTTDKLLNYELRWLPPRADFGIPAEISNSVQRENNLCGW